MLITLFIQGKSSIHWRFYVCTAEFSICCESQCISLNCSSFQHLYLFMVHRFPIHFDFFLLFFYFALMGIRLFWFRLLYSILNFTYSTSSTLYRTILAQFFSSPLCYYATELLFLFHIFAFKKISTAPDVVADIYKINT